jgi:hypothetical protein
MFAATAYQVPPVLQNKQQRNATLVASSALFLQQVATGWLRTVPRTHGV